jgi:hypothetical protein
LIAYLQFKCAAADPSSVRELAEKAKVHHNTVVNIETDRYKGTPATLEALQKALERLGVEFIGGGVKLKAPR